MDDLISRKAAIDAIFGRSHEIIKMRIGNLPSAQPERKRGEWTKEAACPFCGFQPWYEKDIHTLSFCPNFGADMRGEQDDQ